jgi:hypothetical protein
VEVTIGSRSGNDATAQLDPLMAIQYLSSFGRIFAAALWACLFTGLTSNANVNGTYPGNCRSPLARARK